MHFLHCYSHTSAFISRIFVKIGILWFLHIFYSDALIACPLFNLARNSVVHSPSSVIRDPRYGKVSTCSSSSFWMSMRHAMPSLVHSSISAHVNIHHLTTTSRHTGHAPSPCWQPSMQHRWSYDLMGTIQHTREHLTALFPGLSRWAGTRKAKPIWISLKQETVSGSGISWAICKSAPHSRQITVPAPHHSVFYRPDALLKSVCYYYYYYNAASMKGVL